MCVSVESKTTPLFGIFRETSTVIIWPVSLTVGPCQSSDNFNDYDFLCTLLHSTHYTLLFMLLLTGTVGSVG